VLLTEGGVPGRPYRILNNYTRSSDACTTERAASNLCPYAIDAARRSRSPTISTKLGISIGDGISCWPPASRPRRLTPNFWRLSTLLYEHRGDAVDNDRICAELYDANEQPVAANAARENLRRLRRALAGSSTTS
jgi:hypothetical protein